MSGTPNSPFSLSDITQIVDQWFRTMFSEFRFRFVAELSQIKSTKGRYYCDLVQFDDQQSIVAKCRWVIFQASIVDKLITTGVIAKVSDLKGAKLLMSGVCNFHYEYGFSIIINDISHEYLVWQFEKNKQDNLKVLQELGIIDYNHKKELSLPVYHIALISSATSEWLKDFITILQESGYKFETKLYPTMIHGNDAKVEVYQTLKTLYQEIQSWAQIDLVAIIRGWGGSHGIMWQNDINIAKGICHMQVPVMIAIWHTSDQFLLNQLCRFPAKTPSDGAHMLVDIVRWYDQMVADLQLDIQHHTISLAQNCHDAIDNTMKSICSQVANIRSQADQWLALIQNQIARYDPVSILAQWYAVIRNQDAKLITGSDISCLSTGDILHITTAWADLQVLVQDISIHN